jgi:hypothetical protein
MELTTKTNLCDYVNLVSGGFDLIKNEKTCLSCKNNEGLGLGYIWVNGRCMRRPLTNAELRDHLAWPGARYARNMTEVLPSFKKLRADMFRVRDQLYQSACFAYTSSAVMEYHAIKAYNIDFRLSPQWIYDMRAGDSGMSIFDVRDILSKIGVAADIYDPAFAVGLEIVAGINQFSNATIPNSEVKWIVEAASNAACFKIAETAGVKQLTSVADVKSALANVGPVLIGVSVFNYKSQPWKPDSSEDKDKGGHSMVIDGYDDEDTAPGSGQKGCFGVRNCWGKNWGDGGFTKMSYADYADHVRQAWLLTPGFSTAPQVNPPPHAVPLVSPWRPVEPSESTGDWATAGSRWAPTAPVNVGDTDSPLPFAMRALLKNADNNNGDFVSYNKSTKTYVIGKIPVGANLRTLFKPSDTWMTAMAVNLADLSNMPLIRGAITERPAQKP